MARLNVGFLVVAAVVVAAVAFAEPLAGTRPLTEDGDHANKMVEAIKQYLLQATQDSVQTRKPTSDRLAHILGVVERRIEFEEFEVISTLSQPPLLAQTDSYSVYGVRWPTLESIHGEGILIEPKQPTRGFVIALPDASQEPEAFAPAQRLAAAGFTVLVPSLVNRKDNFSGKPGLRMTNQPHREWLYRMTFPLGRHILGLEVQKTLAAVDWFSKRAKGKPIGIWGYGEGGGIALYAAALDQRINVTGVSGYFGPREGLWQQPIYRNVFGLLQHFGDAELAKLIAPRSLIVEAAPGPTVDSIPVTRASRAAPGGLQPMDRQAVAAEVNRSNVAKIGDMQDFIKALGGGATKATTPAVIPIRGADERQQRAISEIETYCERLVERSDRERAKRWEADGPEVIRTRLKRDLLGELPGADLPPNVRTRQIPSTGPWQGYEVLLDATPGVPAYGVLLLPLELRPSDKRAVVVMQHGLDGRPQDLYGQGPGRTFDVYQNIGDRLAAAGYVVYLPQNPYIHDFRPINRLANPLGLTMFSFILRQHERSVAWLQSLPFVDATRIGFYGLSYGGTTALRVPPLIDAYALSICSANFNEWVRKLTTTTEPYSYMFTAEYEIFEFNIAHIAGHAEMAMLMAPRPFMVERGHADGVGIDEWVAFEYAKVARFYDRRGSAERASIAWFEGPHRIDGKATLEFLNRYLSPSKH